MKLLQTITFTVTLLAASPALADDFNDCAGTDPENSIKGCSAIIKAGGEADENLAVAYYNRGVAYHSKGEYDRAIEDFDKAIALNPVDANAYYNRGNAYDAKGQYQNALSDFQRALPNFPPDNKWHDEAQKRITEIEKKVAAAVVPILVDAYARSLETACPARSDGNKEVPQRNPKFVQRVANTPNGVIYVVDGKYSACGDSHEICGGTGGCVTGVFRVKNSTTEVLFEGGMFWWSVSGNRKSLLVRLHGAYCGGGGPLPCAGTINLSTGKMGTFVPTEE
jgi:outer membrane protein assembly factor BamD (BamD/ComL family)